MIIRRKHTANFTTIGNVLFKDERLAADEVGVIAYLLSQPHDWDVRRPALARRWRVGRDSIKRIIHSAMRTGWIVAQKTRLQNGTFHIVYEVRDEPGPELSAEEIKAALSLVSSGAGPDETHDDDGHDGPDASESGSGPPTENTSWRVDQPSLAEPSTANPSRPIRTLQSTDLQRKDSPNRARAYADFKAGWPAANILSDVAAESSYLGLSDADKEAAFEGKKPYLDDCHVQNRKVCDLTTYLKEKRWQRFAAKSSSCSSIAFIKAGTPQWFRWREYYLAIGDEPKYRIMEGRERQGLPYDAPSEWPPALPKSIETDLSKTG